MTRLLSIWSPIEFMRGVVGVRGVPHFVPQGAAVEIAAGNWKGITC